MASNHTAAIIESRIVPSIIVPDVDAAVRFCREAFDAQIVVQGRLADGTTSHAHLRLGDSLLVISKAESTDQEVEEDPPLALRNTSAAMELLVEDLDTALKRALDAGGKVCLTSSTDHCIGEKVLAITDTVGQTWLLSTFINDGGALCI